VSRAGSFTVVIVCNVLLPSERSTDGRVPRERVCGFRAYCVCKIPRSAVGLACAEKKRDFHTELGGDSLTVCPSVRKVKLFAWWGTLTLIAA